MDKLELLQQIEEKQLDISQLAEKVEFDPRLLRLYMIHDTYPMPKRIIQKLSDAIAA